MDSLIPTPLLLVTLALGGCAAGVSGEIEDIGPAVLGLELDGVAVGEPLAVIGDNFPGSDEGWIDLTFEGDFIPADGSDREAVDLTVPIAANADGEVIWDSFGSHRVPFGRGDQLGTFEGWVYGTARYFDGSVVHQNPDTWSLVSLEVKPSIVVLDFRAVGDSWVADCAEPTPNAIHGVPYGMRVKALGFSPAEARFRITEGLIVDGEPSTGPTEVVAEPAAGEAAVLVRFAGVPEHTDGYRVAIAVELRDEAGDAHHVTYPVTVRRPLQVYFNGPMEVAEIYEPSPVSGCIPGGPGGTNTQYSESHSETRTRSIAHTTSRGWEMTYGEEHTETYGSADSLGGSAAATTSTTVTDTTTEGGSETLTDMFSNTSARSRTTSIDFHQSTTDSYGWSVNDETFGEINGEAGAEGSVGIPGIGSIGGSAKAGFVEGSRHGTGSTGNNSATSGSSTSDSTTNSSSSTEAHSRAVGRHWEQSQSYAETNSFTRTDTWNATKTYSDASSQSASISMSLGESDTETLSLSTTDAQSLDTSAEVFAGQFGVWYRQTTRLARQGTVVVYDLCGNGSAVGQVTLDDWTWAPDLAIGASCPPEPNFPQAECRISPCESR